jgi:hypothetical protein
VAGLAPCGDVIKDDFYGGRSHLSEIHTASRLSFNSIRHGHNRSIFGSRHQARVVDRLV